MRRVVLLVAVCLACSSGVQAQPKVTGVAPAAQPHLERGLKHFEAKEYGRALDEFRAAYDLDPQPALLYTIAQTARLSGDCRRASRFYEAFLRTAPNERQALAARQNLERCADELRRNPPPPVPASQPTAAPAAVAPPVGPPAAPAATRMPWRANWLGHGLLIGGLAAVATGVALWGVGHAALIAPRDATDYGTFAARVRDAANAETWQRVGVAAASVGGALVVAGILTYALRPGRPAERPIVTTLLAPGTALLVVAKPW
jgi:tetratricopeptide (TPR) repeat protein